MALVTVMHWTTFFTNYIIHIISVGVEWLENISAIWHDRNLIVIIIIT